MSKVFEATKVVKTIARRRIVPANPHSSCVSYLLPSSGLGKGTDMRRVGHLSSKLFC